MAEKLQIKVCGITSQNNLDLLIRLKTDMAGFIFHPQSPRNIKPDKAASLRGFKGKRVGVFVRQTVEEILEIMQEARLDLAQLHGGQSPDFCTRICSETGADRVIKVLWPEKLDSIAELKKEADRYAGCCRYFLLDSGQKSGGHGRSMNFAKLSRLKLPAPWLLAGGLGPQNIADALQQCSPAGLDLNSGVEESPGQKSSRLLSLTMHSIHNHQS